MQQLVHKLRPAAGFAQVAHVALAVALPVFVVVLVSVGFTQAAFVVILLSKWRMFAVKPRFWVAHFRANAVDIIVGVSLLVFMTATVSQLWRLVWTLVYIVWLTVVKTSAKTAMVALQAMIGFSFGIVALFLVGAMAPSWVLVLGTGAICYVAARHFFDAFSEKYTRFLSYVWAWFGASLAWVLSHWLLYYGGALIAQPALLLIVLAYGLGAMYYLDHQHKLSTLLARQCVFFMVAITVILLALSDWGHKIL